MKIISKIGVSVAIGVIGLSACKNKNEAIDLKSFDDQAYFKALKGEVYKSKTSKKADVEALANLLPDAFNLKYDDISYSEKSGATTLSNVNLTVEDSDIGVNIETVSMWDVNEAALSDRMSGKNLESEFPLLGRIEAHNSSVFGLDSAFKSTFDASNDVFKSLGETLGDKSGLPAEQSLDKYEISLGHFIATDVKVHPWVLNLTDAPFGKDEDKAEATKLWHFFQKMAAWNHVISFEDMAAYDSVFDLAMTQDNESASFNMNADLIGYKGYERGDIEYVGIRDMKYDMDVPAPSEEGLNIQSMSMAASIGSYSYEKMFLSKAMKHMAIGKKPDRNNTDFMSLGVWKSQDNQFSVDGNDLYSFEHFKLDMSEFHGLVPEVIDMKVDNVKYDIAGFMSWTETLSADLQQTAAQKAKMQEGFADVAKVLSKHDMAEPSLDIDFAIHWDAETGVSDMGYGSGIDDVGRFETRFEGILPTYDTVVNFLPEDMDDLDESALKNLFQETSSFKRFYNEISDEGFDKLMAVMIDLAKIAPDDPQSVMLSNATPSQLRQMMSGAVSLGGAQVAQQFPPAAQHINTVADFLLEGGALKIDLEAKSPLKMQDLENLSPEIMTDPDKFEEVFKLDVVRVTSK